MLKPWGIKPWMFDAGSVTEEKGEQKLFPFVRILEADFSPDVKLQRKTSKNISGIDMWLERICDFTGTLSLSGTQRV